MSDNSHYIYASVTYDDDYSEKKYSYKTDNENIKIGDKVLVDRNGNEAYGTVTDVNIYDADSVPYPVEKTKEIIKIIDDDYDDDDYDYDEYRKIEEYQDLIINNMFGKISIKRLMKLNSPKNGEDEWELFYYPRFNTFFYKLDNDTYKLAEYKMDLITDEMFRIIERESIKVKQKRFALTTDNDSYIRAVTFCQENMLPYHDDTDVLEFNEEKKIVYKDKVKPVYHEPKDFDSIKEIKEYLKNEYVPAYWKIPNPCYYIENGKIIHYAGWIEYDMRVFKIIDFLEKNGYVDRKYYNRENYPEFFDENWQSYDYENLDFGRSSYMLLRIFNIERICEGTVNSMASSGTLLKLVERVEYLKENKLDE